MYVATSNPGKLRDFAHAAGHTIPIEPLPGLAAIAAPSENAPTFEGNARAKAIYYSLHAPGEIVLADDSGLEVNALGGAPGVRSARFADDLGYPTSTGTLDNDANGLDARNNACLLYSLLHLYSLDRRARYRCILAAARDGQVLEVAEGVVEGEILSIPKGGGGFGYDPLFYLPQYGKSMAELDPAARLTYSHRGAALRHILTLL